uniref:Uncharacterized protein LOC108042341 n=1 Tax=Drosophila rhopaloa TaxID=1041015 RepID=A0A6P4EDC0_DRORH
MTTLLIFEEVIGDLLLGIDFLEQCNATLRCGGITARINMNRRNNNRNKKQKSNGIGSLATGDLSRMPEEEAHGAEVEEDIWIKQKLLDLDRNPETWPDYAIINGKLYRHLPSWAADKDTQPWKLCVAKSQRARVLRENHSEATAGHLGVRKTKNRMKATPTTKETTTATTRQTKATPKTKETTAATTRQRMATTTTKETTRQTTDNEARPPMPRTTTGTKRHELADFQRPRTKWVTPRRLSSLDHTGIKPINLSEECEEEWDPKPRGYNDHKKRVEEAVVRLKATWRSGTFKTRAQNDKPGHTNSTDTSIVDYHRYIRDPITSYRYRDSRHRPLWVLGTLNGAYISRSKTPDESLAFRRSSRKHQQQGEISGNPSRSLPTTQNTTNPTYARRSSPLLGPSAAPTRLLGPSAAPKRLLGPSAAPKPAASSSYLGPSVATGHDNKQFINKK